MRYILAVLLLGHGIAHLVGFAVAMRLGRFPELPYRTTLLGGAVDVGDGGMRVVGLAWLGLAVGFGVVAAGLALRQPWWPGAAWWVTGLSLLMCALNLPAARVGLGFNLFLVAALGIGLRFGVLQAG